MSSIRALVVLGFAALFCSSSGAAQERFFPAVGGFELPEASPRVYGVVGRLISTRRGESRFGNEREAEAILGENLPLVAIRRGPRPIVLGIGSQVYGRFSLDDAKTALISVDWVAGLNATAVLGSWAATLEIYHESSHLGDEYGDRFQAQRLDWSREVVAGWATYGMGRWRVTGGASYVIYDGLRLPRTAAAIGVDFGGARHQMLTRAVEPIMGLYIEAAAATGWRLSNSAKLGLAFRQGEGSRRLGVAIIAHHGLSTQRQFFGRDSQYLGLEVRFDL